jgi:hypothetical protein
VVSCARCVSSAGRTDRCANPVRMGDRDGTVGRVAAEGTGEVIAAPYQFEVLPGVGHYAAAEVPEKMTHCAFRILPAILFDHRRR